ncbi:MAG: aldehyde dehydrogenase family protein [Candidatus Nanopelagicales bacterium]
MNLDLAQNLEGKQTFSKLSPVNGEVLANYVIFSKEDVSEAVAQAHLKKAMWQALSFYDRKTLLLQWSKYLAKNLDELAGLVVEETGKPKADASLEVALAIEHIAWAAKNAKDILATQSRPSGVLLFNMDSKVQFMPMGVVGVIGPWNYPVFTPVGSIAYALAAGNTVIFKPSEFTPGVGLWLERSFALATNTKNVLTTLTGLADTGKFLTESKVNKIAFTGSTRTAKKVAASCAENMTPVILECGGKDPVIVAEDADISLAAEYALWSAMANAGQSCIGAERVYVHETIADSFIEKMKLMAAEVKPGVSYGPATMPSQLQVIEKHIKAAETEGVKFLIGGPDSIQPPFVMPTIMLEVPESSVAMTEETFGPTIAINRVSSIQQAIELANKSNFGLAAAVFSKKQSEEIASELHCGMVSINSVFSFAGVPSIPFGGVKDSGYGRIHGPEGLLEFVSAKSIIRPKFQGPLKLTTFKRRKIAEKITMKIIKWLHR